MIWLFLQLFSYCSHWFDLAWASPHRTTLLFYLSHILTVWNLHLHSVPIHCTIVYQFVPHPTSANHWSQLFCSGLNNFFLCLTFHLTQPKCPLCREFLAFPPLSYKYLCTIDIPKPLSTHPPIQSAIIQYNYRLPHVHWSDQPFLHKVLRTNA